MCGVLLSMNSEVHQAKPGGLGMHELEAQLCWKESVHMCAGPTEAAANSTRECCWKGVGRWPHGHVCLCWQPNVLFLCG